MSTSDQLESSSGDDGELVAGSSPAVLGCCVFFEDPDNNKNSRILEPGST